VLVRAEQDGGRWKFDGLRDPLAADPSGLLAAAGADTAQVDQHWERYLSLQPQLVLARARAALKPPAGVRLALAGDTLRLQGPAPHRWLASTARAAGLPAGVAALDLSGVVPDLPPELSGRVAEVEQERVLFAVGSALLDARARAAVARIAAALVRVQSAAAVLGAGATIELQGRTDPTGTDAANQTLSRERAETVLNALAAQGTSPADVRVNALGTTNPLAQGDPALNRSVSFTVSLR
jgi:OOP family OmpA-OmpF porin